MIISLDYDGTYTRDPMLWYTFLKDAKNRGHEVIVITMRYENGVEDLELKRIFEPMGVRIIFTGRLAKESFCAQIGVFPKIWIDDNPHWVSQNAVGNADKDWECPNFDGQGPDSEIFCGAGEQDPNCRGNRNNCKRDLNGRE